jgi:multidrug efflux pump subunit AcrA (membrane-fusion protein)
VGSPDDLTGRSGDGRPRPTAADDGTGSRIRRRRPGRRAAMAVGTVTALAVGAAGIAAARAGDDPPAPPPERPVKTASVSKTDLVERATVDGTLSYGTTTQLGGPRPGTVTWLPAVGATVGRGEPLARIDERAVPVLAGAVPLYRDLAVGIADGEDVRQLEENLVALGHGIDGLVVDTHYDWATRAAVQGWQRTLGWAQTGAVRTDDLVFATVPLRIAEHRVEVGQHAGPGQPMVTVSGTERTVTVRLDASRQSLVDVGDATQIELPDRRTTGGHISAVATVAEKESGASGSDSKPKIPVTITLDDPAAAGRLDEAPVSVRITEREAVGALAVPVKALLAVQQGGYAVEVVEADGHRRYVPVRTGAYAGGLVEIAGDVEVGDTVVVAS